MSVETIFEFRFSPETREEGLRVSEAIGGDMPPLDGYLDHEVVRDFEDPGHLLIVTRWASQDQANAVLAEYVSNPRVTEATDLHGGPPAQGFVGEIVPKSS